jgi:hypothetical protein
MLAKILTGAVGHPSSISYAAGNASPAHATGPLAGTQVAVISRQRLQWTHMDWEHRLVEEGDAQQAGAHAGGARVERVSWFRYPVLIPLGTACSALDPYKYKIVQWFKTVM